MSKKTRNIAGALVAVAVAVGAAAIGVKQHSHAGHGGLALAASSHSHDSTDDKLLASLRGNAAFDHVSDVELAGLARSVVDKLEGLRPTLTHEGVEYVRQTVAEELDVTVWDADELVTSAAAHYGSRSLKHDLAAATSHASVRT